MSHQRQQPQQQLAARQQSTVSQQQHFPPQHQQQSMQQKLAQQETLKDTTQRITQVVTSLKHELETRTKELQVASQHLQEKTEQGRQLKAQMQQVQGQNEQLKNRITELQRKEADVAEGVWSVRSLLPVPCVPGSSLDFGLGSRLPALLCPLRSMSGLDRETARGGPEETSRDAFWPL
eukprot:m.676570 g.676570  ORF g.676570 m.676570 type:complete len:178 (-) comp58563_c0_seq10:2232-2765(-)